MIILSHPSAKREIVKSLFNPNGTLGAEKKIRYNGGKYNKTVVGKEIPQDVESRVKLIWAERRTDKDGVYYALFCISK